MGSFRKVTIGLGAAAALLAFSVTPTQAADQCRKACNNSYTTCSKSKGPDACLPSWGQCKAKCKRTATAVKAPASTPAKPAAKPTTTASR